jgi:hypothetical protein
MPFCINCGVELDTGVERCPLCAYTMPDTAGSDSSEQYPVPALEPDNKITSVKTRKIITIEIVSIIFAGLDIIVVGIDYMLNSSLTWSPYPLAAITGLWVYIVLILLIAKRLYRTIVVSACVTIVMLAGIDFADGAFTWFLPLAIPISVSTFLLTYLSFLVFHYRKHFSLIIASVVAGAGIEGIIIDYFVSMFVGSEPFSWSLIIMAGLFPLIVVCLIHFLFLKRYFDVDKYIHL